MAQQDLKKLEKLNPELNKLFEIIDGTKGIQPLTQEQISLGTSVAREYYSYLSGTGEEYGKLALGVVDAATAAGRFALKHMKVVARKHGINEEQISRMHNEGVIYLAAKDVQMRMASLKDPIDNPVSEHDSKIIPDYHYEMFDLYKCTGCWTGTLFNKVGSPTDWKKITTGDTSLPNIHIQDYIQAYKEDRVVDGLKVREMVSNLVQVMDWEIRQNMDKREVKFGDKTFISSNPMPMGDTAFIIDFFNTDSAEMFSDVGIAILKGAGEDLANFFSNDQIKSIEDNKDINDMHQKYQEEQALPCCEVGEIEIDFCKVCHEEEL